MNYKPKKVNLKSLANIVSVLFLRMFINLKINEMIKLFEHTNIAI